MTKFILTEPGVPGSYGLHQKTLPAGRVDTWSPSVTEGQGVLHGPSAGVFSGAGGAGPLVPGPASSPLAPLGLGLSLGGHPGVLPPAAWEQPAWACTYAH